MSRWFSADVSQSFKQTRSKIEVFWNVIAVVALGLYSVFGANGCPAVMSLVKLNAHCFLLNVSYFANSLILFGLHQTSCLFLYRSAPTAVLSNLLKCQLSLLSYFILKLYLTSIVLHLHGSPAKSRDTASFSQFLEDFRTLMSSISTTPYEFLITGD